MELELKHLAAYLPYGLKINIGYYTEKNVLLTVGILTGYAITSIKPILRPLSDLTKEIDCPEVMGEKIVPIDIIYKIWYEKDLSSFSKRILNDKIRLYPESMPYWLVQKLLEWHFNIFNLPENLYIDLNSLK